MDGAPLARVVLLGGFGFQTGFLSHRSGPSEPSMRRRPTSLRLPRNTVRHVLEASEVTAGLLGLAASTLPTKQAALRNAA